VEIEAAEKNPEAPKDVTKVEEKKDDASVEVVDKISGTSFEFD
jgi:hypothetical protein